MQVGDLIRYFGPTRDEVGIVIDVHEEGFHSGRRVHHDHVTVRWMDGTVYPVHVDDAEVISKKKVVK